MDPSLNIDACGMAAADRIGAVTAKLRRKS